MNLVPWLQMLTPRKKPGPNNPEEASKFMRKLAKQWTVSQPPSTNMNPTLYKLLIKTSSTHTTGCYVTLKITLKTHLPNRSLN